MTDLLATIDDVVTDWEAQPEAWNPGDPLYKRPNPLVGGQYVRPIFQLIDDVEVPRRMRCEPCQVSWIGADPCWSCGAELPRVRTTGPYIMFGDVDLSPGDSERMVRAQGAWVRAQEAMREMAETMMRQLDERISEQVEQLRATSTIPAPELRVSVMRPDAMPRHLNVSCLMLPTVEDILAPTVAELTQGIDLGEFVTGVELTPPVAPPAEDDDTRTVPTFWGDVVLTCPRYPLPTTEENR